MATDHKGPGHNRDHNFIMEKKSQWDGSEVHPTLNQSFNTGAIGYSNQELFSQGGSGLVQAIPIHDQAVRRLTPKECERLQGFPDDHTLIPWRNKPADQCPDGPRYKALGNSMAVPCMRWIGERIARAENERQGAA